MDGDAAPWFLSFSFPFRNLYVPNEFTALMFGGRARRSPWACTELTYLLPTACFALNKIICFCNILPFLFVFHFHNDLLPACRSPGAPSASRATALLQVVARKAAPHAVRGASRDGRFRAVPGGLCRGRAGLAHVLLAQDTQVSAPGRRRNSRRQLSKRTASLRLSAPGRADLASQPGADKFLPVTQLQLEATPWPRA